MEELISRAEVFEIMGNLMSIPYDFDRQITEKDVSESMDKLKALPPVTPTHGTCKGCEHYKRIELNSCDEVVATCKKHTDKNYQYVSPNFYCADFEKRGNLDGSN